MTFYSTVHEARLNVLHVISSIDPKAGGPSIALGGLAKAQASLGMGVRVLSTFGSGSDDSIARSLRDAGVTVDLVGPIHKRFEKRSILSAAVREAVRWADVVHIHAIWEEVQHVAARTARQEGRTYFMRPCGMLDPWSLKRRKLFKTLYMRFRLRKDFECSAGMHYTTEAERELAAPLGIGAPAIVVPNGVEFPEELQDRRDIAREPVMANLSRESLKIPPTALVLAHLGRVDKKKGIEFTIEALAELRASKQDAHLIVIGAGDAQYKQSLVSLARRLGCDDAVHYLGMQLGMAKYAALRLADLFVLPSYQENFGNAVAEAMAVGLPVVITDKVNLSDAVLRANAGLVVNLDPTDSLGHRLGAALGKFANDPSALVAAGENGRRYAEEHLEWSAIAQQWKANYEQAIATRKQK